MDRLSAALGERYDGGTEGEAAVADEQRVAQAESALLTANADHVKATADFYRLDEGRLALHCQMLQDVCRREGIPLRSLMLSAPFASPTWPSCCLSVSTSFE